MQHYLTQQVNENDTFVIYDADTKIYYKILTTFAKANRTNVVEVEIKLSTITILIL